MKNQLKRFFAFLILIAVCVSFMQICALADEQERAIGTEETENLPQEGNPSETEDVTEPGEVEAAEETKETEDTQKSEEIDNSEDIEKSGEIGEGEESVETDVQEEQKDTEEAEEIKTEENTEELTEEEKKEEEETEEEKTELDSNADKNPLRIYIDSPGQCIYVDGVLTVMDSDGCITLPSENSRVVTSIGYLYNSDGYQYPNPYGLQVYFIKRDEDNRLYAERQNSLDALLQYCGSSIKTSGDEKGIRVITGIPTETKELLKMGLDGWVLSEYGTVVAWDGEIGSGDPTLDMACAKSATAFVSGGQDSVFSYSGSVTQYTNVLTFDTYDKCNPSLAIRPYLKLTNGAESITIYGGTVHRSIVYIAYQNKDAFSKGTVQNAYIKKIILNCDAPAGIEPVEVKVCNYLCIGNSITYRQPDGKFWWGSWGMAASAASKDYYHLVAAKLLTSNDIMESKVFYLGEGTEALWEASSDRSSCLYLLDSVLSSELTLVTIQVGENVTDRSTFATDLQQLIEYIQNAAPDAQIIIVGDVWGSAKCDTYKQAVASAMGIGFADLSAIKNDYNYRAGLTYVYGDDGKVHAINNIGVATHLGDKGMAYVANAILPLVK